MDEDNIKSWMRLLTQQPRSLQMLTADHPAMAAVKDHFTKHLTDLKIKQLTEKGYRHFGFVENREPTTATLVSISSC